METGASRRSEQERGDKPGGWPPPGGAFDLRGKIALVTGGSRGLGRAIAMAFAAAGAEVIVASRKLQSCEAVAQSIRDLGREAHALPCHVGRWPEIDAMIDKVIERFGRIDLLVNCAGMSPATPSAVDVEEPLFEKILAVNFKGGFRLTARVGAEMARTGGGSIINISSVAGLRPNPGTAVYAAAKAALNAASVALALELAAKGVRVNVISPGAFDTDVAAGWSDRDAVAGRAAMGRIGRPQEIVSAALYFASDRSSFTTGANLCVDGGRS